MKRKTITLVVYMLVCISLVSVGFAAWVITGGDETSTTAGITASNVQDKSLTISNESWINSVYTSDTLTGKIVFGAPASYENGSNWLQVGTGTGTQQLFAIYQFTLSCDEEFKLSQTVNTAAITYNDGTSDPNSKLKACIDNGYIKAATVSFSVNNGDFYATTDNSHTLAGELKKITGSNSTTVQIKIEYKWGFGDNLNPFNYYAGTTASADAPKLVDGEEQASYKEQAIKALEAIYLANATSMTLNVAVTSVSAS